MSIQSIIWGCTDKKKVAIKAISKHKNMKKIIEITPDKIKEQNGKMTAVQGAVITDMPHAPSNPQRAEYRIANCIDTKDILTERYRGAREFLDWFEPAWNAMEKEEQYILYEFHGKGNNTGAAKRLSFELNYSVDNVYNIKDRALDKLSVLLMG